MMRFAVGYFCLAFALVFGVGVVQQVCAQDFPYAVPQAPEFDREGNSVAQNESESQSPRKQEKRSFFSSHENSRGENRISRPRTVPSPPRAPRVQPEAPARPQYNPPPPQSQRPAMAATPPQPMAQPQARPDCSQYPLLIARARSQEEMQMAARMYLTCLLQNGWAMDQAKKHVINTIETTYRLAR